jgi:hypothetical protein
MSDGREVSAQGVVMAFLACELFHIWGSSDKKNYFNGSSTEENLGNTELSQWLKPQVRLLNTFLPVYTAKL